MVIELVVNLENHKRRIWSICWSPDGNFLGSVGSDRYIIIWHKKKNTRIRSINNGNKIMNASNTSGGKKYIRSLIEFDVYDIIETNHEKSLRHIEFSKDGNFFVVASFDSRCSIYKKNKNNKWVFHKTLEGHEKEVKCASIHPSNKYIVTCGRDKSIWIHAKVDNSEKKKLHNNNSYNNGILSTTKYNPNYNTNALIDDNFDFNFDAYLTAHTEDIKFVSWCPLSENTFISLSYDNSIKIWNKKLDEWHCIQTLNEHSSVVWCVTFNFDGSEFATCSDDKTIKIWQSTKKKSYNRKKYPFLYQHVIADLRETTNGFHKNHLSRTNSYSEKKKISVKDQETKEKYINKNNNNNVEMIKEKKNNEEKATKKDNNVDSKLKEQKIKKENDYDSCNFTIVNYSENECDLQNILKIFVQNKFVPLYFQCGLFKFMYKYREVVENIKKKNDFTSEKIQKKEPSANSKLLKNELVNKNNIINMNNKKMEKKINKNNEDKTNIINVDKMMKTTNVEKMNKNNANKINTNIIENTNKKNSVQIIKHNNIEKINGTAMDKMNKNNNESINKKNTEKVGSRNIKDINESCENIKDIIFDDWEIKHVIEGYHKRSVSYIDWNAYENLIAVSSFDNSLKIFEKTKENWELIENVENAHLSDVNCVVWCPQKFQDYFLLATAGDDCVINIWKFMKKQ